MRAAAVVLASFLSACASGGYLRTDLFFGLSRPDGGSVGPAEWALFLD